MGTWMNNDNLYLKFGTDKTTPHKAGEYRLDGPEHVVTVHVVCDELTATETIIDDVTVLPAGALVTRVTIMPTETAADGTAVDVGLIRQTDRSTEIDYDGLLQAYVTASLAIGNFEEHTLADTGADSSGALVGTVLANAGMISASRTDASAFTAGEFDLSVYYMIP